MNDTFTPDGRPVYDAGWKPLARALGHSLRTPAERRAAKADVREQITYLERVGALSRLPGGRWALNIGPEANRGRS